VEEPVFDAAFGLDQVYVPLRGWYKEEREEAPENPDVVPFGMKKTVRVVVETHAALDSWMRSNDQQDSIRLISGGPGSGKSTFAKMFAREQSQADRRVLFVLLI
jgi:Mrp family chromosome partitioning ATPase